MKNIMKKQIEWIFSNEVYAHYFFLSGYENYGEFVKFFGENGMDLDERGFMRKQGRIGEFISYMTEERVYKHIYFKDLVKDSVAVEINFSDRSIEKLKKKYPEGPWLNSWYLIR